MAADNPKPDDLGPCDFDPVAYINSPRWRHSSLGLGRMALLLDKLGNPQERFKSVHVAGTNGKGSVCSYVSAILQAAGNKVGLFTSPYIERFEERIRVQGNDIPPDDLLRCTLEVRDRAWEVEAECGEHPTEFELMCAVAFLHFAHERCDFAVVEVGLGGRLDATNVIVPRLCVITRIGLDHTDLLGDTLEAIAKEKAGIIKSGVPVVSWPQEGGALAAIERKCFEAASRLVVADFSKLDMGPIDSRLRAFSYEGHVYKTRLLASYQPQNAVVAIEAARTLGEIDPDATVTETAIRTGIADAVWPGRFEIVRERPLVIVDGSHNPQGAEGLACSLEALLGKSARATLVVGVLADKDYVGILSPLLRFANRIITYTPDNPRALDAGELAYEAETLCARMAQDGADASISASASAQAAIVEAVHEEGPDGVVVAFGTLYSIGAIKRALTRL